MKSRSKKILAIAPGNRTFGIAVFDGVELAHFRLCSLYSNQSSKLLQREIVKLIQGCILTFRPHAVAVKAISQYQKKSAILRSTARTIERQVDRSHIALTQVSLDQVKAVLCKCEKPTQIKAFEHLTVLYPELKRYFDLRHKWQNEYYHNLFSAVAVGVVLLRSFSKPEQ